MFKHLTFVYAFGKFKVYGYSFSNLSSLNDLPPKAGNPFKNSVFLSNLLMVKRGEPQQKDQSYVKVGRNDVHYINLI